MTIVDMVLFLLILVLGALLVRCFYSISDLRDSNRAIKRVLETQYSINENSDKIMHNFQKQLDAINAETTCSVEEITNYIKNNKAL